MNDPYKVLGVPETATDAEVKKAYLNLARKYHPDNYHDNPLADLAQEKMKEINAAYEQITRERGSKGGGSSASSSSSGYGGSAYGSGYGGSYGGYGGSYGSYSGSSSVLQQVRMAISTGDLSRAEALLANYSDHTAEWNFLRGAVCYRRGWMDEALRYYQTACQMDPSNAEYRRALDYMEHAGETAYHPEGRPFGTDFCTANPCLTLCCVYALCNGGGYYFCC